MRDDPANHMVHNLTPENPLPMIRYGADKTRCYALVDGGKRQCRNPRWLSFACCQLHHGVSLSSGVVYV